MIITHERLCEVLDYDPETGVLRWKVKISPQVRPGDVAGTLNHGRQQIQIDGRIYRSHRLAWFHHYGAWPQRRLDHIDGDACNNRVTNLREATQAQNMQNRHGPNRSTTSGRLGVSPRRGRWRATITVDHKQRHLGDFATINEAEAAYQAAKIELHPFASAAAR